MGLALTSVRVTAYDRDGKVVLNGTAEISESTLEGWQEALQKAAVYLPNDRTIVSTVGTSGTIVPVDAYGNAVFEPKWYYETAPDQAEQFLGLDLTDELSSKGVPLSAASPIAKILALRDRDPDRFSEIEWILSPATWLLYQLHYSENERWTELETDWTNALKFGADITHDPPEWFVPLFTAVDISPSLFPAIRAPGSTIGHAESTLAANMGLANAELYQGLTDGNVSVLASGCLQPGDCSIISGSTSVIKYVSETIEPHEALYYHQHPIDGYLPGAAFDSGVVLEWFCQNLFDISRKQGLELARTIPAGKEPRVYLQGNRSPFFDPNMGTTILDLWPDEEHSIDQARGMLIRGIVSSITLSEYTYFPLLEEHFDQEIDRIHLVSGGEADSDDPFSWWNTLRASIWNREVLKMEPRTTIGPLIPATLTASVYSDVDEASDQLLRVDGQVHSDPSLREVYTPIKTEFRREWQAVSELYDRTEI